MLHKYSKYKLSRVYLSELDGWGTILCKRKITVNIIVGDIPGDITSW